MAGFDLKQALEIEKENAYTVDLPSGEVVELPPDIPWAALQKYKNIKEADVSGEMISEALELLFGKEGYKTLVSAGARPGSYVQMDIFVDVMSHIKEMMPGDERVGKTMAESQTNQTNGTPQDHKKKAKRSR